MVNDYGTNPDAEDRQRHVGQAQSWTACQAQRLGISPGAIDAAIRRGWLPREIERVGSGTELSGGPR